MSENSQRVSELERILLEDPWEATTPPEGPCPDPETVGALIAGTLPAEERARVEEHIASCERCYEGYATAVTFLGDEECDEAASPEQVGTVTPFRPATTSASEGSTSAPAKPSRAGTARPFRWGLAAAAAVLIATSTAWFVQSRRLPSQATLLSELKGNPAVAGQLWDTDNLRGPGGSEDLETTSENFQAGALSFDLLLAIEHGKAGLAASYADTLASVLESQASQTASRLVEELRELAPKLRAEGAKTQTFEKRVLSLAEEVEELSFDRSAYSFGALLESGRIATGLGDAELLRPERLLRALDRWQREGRITEDSEEAFTELRRRLQATPLDLKAIRESIDEIERFYSLALVDPNQLIGLDSLDDPLPTPTPPPQPGK